MALDPRVVGKWYVSYGQYRYFYTLAASGAVRWRDYWSSSETGVGTCRKTGDGLDFFWDKSETSEHWNLNEAAAGFGYVTTRNGSVVADYGTFRDLVAIKQDTVDAAKDDVIRQWADALKSDNPFSSPAICGLATPYFAIEGYDQAPLAAGKIGGPMNHVKGLAIHTTAGNPSRKDWETVNGTVHEWNKRAGKVSAHFAIAPSGKLIQIVPVDRIAYAQGDASPYYLSVEIETADMKAMNGAQMTTVQSLFAWVVGRFGVPPKLATGFVGKNLPGTFAADAKRAFDPITKDICSSDTTTDLKVASSSPGLSCHYWVSPTKPCPGSGMLRQMPQIVNG